MTCIMKGKATYLASIYEDSRHVMTACVHTVVSQSIITGKAKQQTAVKLLEVRGREKEGNVLKGQEKNLWKEIMEVIFG